MDCTDHPQGMRIRSMMRRGRGVHVVLVGCCGLAACHNGMRIGRTDASIDGSSEVRGQTTARGGSGGAASVGGGSGGITDGSLGGTAGAAPLADGGTGSGGLAPAGGAAGSRRGTNPSGGTGSGGLANPGSVAPGGQPGSSLLPEPVDNRPARPAWTPPFDTPLGTPGWQQSTQPICDANQGSWARSGFDIWADDRGVFALVGDGCAPDLGVPCGGAEGASIKLNPGSGWQLVYQFPPGSFSVSSPRLWPSVANGPLLVTGDFAGYGSGAAFVDNGIFAFQILARSYGAFAVGPDLAYVLDDDGVVRRLLGYSRGVWSTVGDVGGLAVWANHDFAITAGYDQTIAMLTGSAPMTVLSGVPAGEYQSVWAFAPDDVWFGNRAGQLVHYDGSHWQAHPSGSRNMGSPGIQNLWGTPGTLYFTTSTELGRWDGARAEILLSTRSDTNIGGIWGRSANEVFIALKDWRYRDNACGSVFALWFDGTQFHQF
jgi:hypothetical protein